MTDSEKIKGLLIHLLANMDSSNIDQIADTIEAMIEVRIAELMEQLSDRMGQITADAKAGLPSPPRS